MKKILIDTDIIVDFLRCQNKTDSLFWQLLSLRKYQPMIALTTVVELWAGKSMAKKRTQRFVEETVAKCEIIFPSLKTAKTAGELLRQTNYQISFQDAQIGATALENKLPLLTLNERDFKKIKGIKLDIEI